MTTLEPYESYRTTSIPWLEALPIDWSASRLGYETWVRARLGWKGLKADEYVDSGFAFLSTPNIKRRDIDFERVNFVTKERYDESPEIKLSVDDVLLAKDGSTLGTVNVVRDLPVPATVNSSIAVLTPGPRCEGRFVHYLIQSELIQSAIEMLKGGMGVPHLFQDDIRRMPIPRPPRDVQARIVDYLDRETDQIDDLIGKQEKLIELLAEKRQAIITHAVTKGLDPSVPTKPSGVNWLGDIPAHWECKQIKWLTQVRRGASPRPIDNPVYFDENGEWSWVRIADVSASDGTLNSTTQRLSDLGSSLSVKLEPGSLFVSIAGTVGKPCINRIKACIHDGFVYFPTLRIDPQYLFRIFEAGRCYEGLGKMGTQLNLNTDTIGSIYVPVPPRDEIGEILTALSSRLHKLDALSSKITQFKERLIERRAALISAAVTGKIDVRKGAA